MPEKDSALGQLSAMKARYTEKDTIETVDGGQLAPQTRRLMAPQYWRAAAILLALFCGIFLSLAYRESKDLSKRRSELELIERRLADSENRLMELSTEIGTMSAQRESLASDILKLRSEAANYAESSAENRILGKTLPPLKDEYTALISKMASLRKSKTDLEGQVRSVEEKLANVQADFDSRDRKLQEIDKELNSKRMQMVEVERELADKQTAVAGTRRSISDYEGQRESTKSAYEDLKRQIASLDAERSKLNETITAGQASLNTVQANYTSEKSRLEILTEESNRLDTQIIEDRKKAADAQKKLRSLMDEISSLETKQKQLGGIEKTLTTATKELASVEADTAVKNAKLIELLKSVKVTEAAISSKQSAADGLQTQIKKLEATRLDLNKDISRLQGQQDVLKKNAEPAGPKQAG